jgi:hypothetical protein
MFPHDGFTSLTIGDRHNMTFLQLRRYWRLTSIVHVLLVPFMLFFFLIPNPPYYPLLVGLQAILAIGVTCFAFWITAQRLEDLRKRLQNYALPISLVMLLLCVVIAFTVLWYMPVYAIFAVTTPLTFGFILWTLYPDKPLHVSKGILLTLALIVAAVIAVRVYALSVYPPIHRTDEGWAMSWSVNYALTGQMDDLLMKVDLPSYELRYANIQLEQFAAVPALWLRIVGIGYWETRLFHFLLLIVISAFTTGVAYNWYGRGAAWCTAFAMLGSSTLMQLANTRLDSGYTLTLAASLYLSTEADKRNKLWLHFLAGVVAGLGVFSHLHAVAFGVVLTLALYLPRYIAGLRQKHWFPPKSAVLFGLGGGIVGAAVFVWLILPYLPLFLQTIGYHGKIHEQGFFYSLSMNLWNIYFYSGIEAIMLIVGVIALTMRRQARDWNLLLLVVGLHISLSIIAPAPYDQYVRPIAPVYALIAGALLSQGLSKVSLKSLSWAQTMTAVFAMTVLVLFSIRPELSYILEGGTLRLQPTPATEWIREHVSTDERILAPTEYYLWLPEYTNMRSLYIEALQNRELGLNLPGEQIWDAVEARYIIYDTTQKEDMLPESLFESGYLVLNNYVPIVTLHQGNGIVIVYELQSP